MIDALLNSIDHAIRIVLDLIGRDRAGPLALGLLLSGFSTQFIKSIPAVICDPNRVLLTELWAIFVGTAGVFVLYPAPLNERVITALAAGFGSPVLYRVTTWVLARCGNTGRVVRANLSGDPQHSKTGTL